MKLIVTIIFILADSIKKIPVLLGKKFLKNGCMLTKVHSLLNHISNKKHQIQIGSSVPELGYKTDRYT